MHGSPIPVNSSAILRGKTMKGALFGGLKAKSDIPLLVKSYKDKVILIISFNKNIIYDVKFYKYSVILFGARFPSLY